jgi:hypothetical protein
VKANFPDAYISKLKRVKKGFVDIAVGDFKVSHLSEHPNLYVHGAPRVRFSQTDGQDLFGSKSLASLYIRLVSKKRHRVLKCIGLQACRVVLLTPLARSFRSQRPCFQRGL